MADLSDLKNLIDPKKQPDKNFFLELLDEDKQREAENQHIYAVMQVLRIVRLGKLKAKLKAALAEKDSLKNAETYNAESYRRITEINAEIGVIRKAMNEFKPFFEEPYFARMDLVDDKEGYNSYYIGKHGDEKLEIVDWRAPLARRYYQKSKTAFSINEYNYTLILRRALRTKNGKVLDMKNEYLNLSSYLSEEEIGGRDETLVFDPFLKEILRGRKEKQEICDIIETIQEKQFEIITLPERDEFVLQGVAGSGKTMILLHRLSYIMYNNESLSPSDVLVITPSDSFNAFIDELSAVLELEKVKCSTLDNYYLKMLSSVGADLKSRFDFNLQANPAYLKYIYSKEFSDDLDKKLASIFGGIYGLFTSEECMSVTRDIERACDIQSEEYDKIKNASLRVRRCVLGEIKEKPDGGLYYTKQFRYLFNCVADIREFLGITAIDERMKGYAYFYRQLLSFYKSLKYVRRYSHKICVSAIEDLQSLFDAVEREIADLKRYKIKTPDGEQLTYAGRIEKREELKKEIGAAISRVERISDAFSAIQEFADVLRTDSNLIAIGKCESTLDILRFFYRETVKKTKKKYNADYKMLTKCDAFALCLILTKLGFDLSPKYSYIFVDEAQDISLPEYGVLKTVNDRAVFNIFGDLKQNITGFRGITDWSKLGYRTYDLNLNYRNTNQIVDFVSKNLGIEMKSIGFDGPEAERISSRSVTGWLSEKNGLKAVICSEQSLEKYIRKSYNVIRESGRISKTKINFMTVYESKGLEFTAVAVADADMTENEKYIAYTRALKELAIIV